MVKSYSHFPQVFPQADFKFILVEIGRFMVFKAFSQRFIPVIYFSPV